MEPQKNYDVLIGVLLDTDENSSGPAPLQNSDIHVETFEGVTNMNDSTTSHTANYFMVVDTLQTVVN